MSNRSESYDWRSLRAQFGDLVRLAIHRLLIALRDQPVVFFVLIATAAISYHALFLLASGETYRPAVWVAVLFPFQLDLAGWPGLKVALDNTRVRWQRVTGAAEAVFVVVASGFGNVASVLGFAQGDEHMKMVSNIYLAVLSPVMLILCLVIAHMPRTAPAKAPATREPATPGVEERARAVIAANPGIGRRALLTQVPGLRENRARVMLRDERRQRPMRAVPDLGQTAGGGGA